MDSDLRQPGAQNEWACVGHYYEPIPYYQGRVLKYRGIACAVNLGFMLQRPGMRLLPERIADRIDAETLAPFTD